jgi:hypothetical protein
MTIAKPIQMIEAELETLEYLYEELLTEKLLAIKFGKKSEVAELKRECDLAWARYETLATFRTNLKYELEKFAVAE